MYTHLPSYQKQSWLYFLALLLSVSFSSPAQTIVKFAGTGNFGFGEDGGPATDAQIYWPSHIVFDGSGNLYIADQINNRIRKVNTSGIITTVAGNGTKGFSGDGGPATSAALHPPSGLAVASDGSIYIADTENYRVR